MIELSHIGEVLLSKILEGSFVARELCFKNGLELSNEIDFVPEIRLNKCGQLIFDGVHKVDVSVLDRVRGVCVPIEAKLGLDRLSKNEFERRFLNDCETSHNNTRVKGSMISVLERRLPPRCFGSDLSVTYNGQEFKLTNEWILICRQAVIDRWRMNGRPNFSFNCRVVSFEELARNYGDAVKFNELVSSLLVKDFYAEWVHFSKQQ